MKPKLNETSRKFVWLTEKADAKEVEIKRWPELDASTNAYEPHRLYADQRRHPVTGELLGSYARSPGPCERLLAICESGRLHGDRTQNQGVRFHEKLPNSQQGRDRSRHVQQGPGVEVGVRFIISAKARTLFA